MSQFIQGMLVGGGIAIVAFVVMTLVINNIRMDLGKDNKIKPRNWNV